MAILLTIRPTGESEPTSLTFDQQRVRLGRGAMCDLRLPHRAVSSVHAMILLEGDRFYLLDPGSTNGTTVNDELLVIERRKLLRSGDVIGIAGYEVEFHSGVAMVSHHSQERTGAVARQLAQHVMAEDGQELRPPAFVVLGGPQEGERFELHPPGAMLTVGRADDNDIILDDREVSRYHLEVEVGHDVVSVRDVGGKNELRVNDKPVIRCRLRDRDELLVGATMLVYDEPVEAYLRELAQWPDAEYVAAPKEDRFDESDDTMEERGEGGDGERESEAGRSEVRIVKPSAVEDADVELAPAGEYAEDEQGIGSDGRDEDEEGRRETSGKSVAGLRRGEREWNLGALKASTPGLEVAILFVGAIVLAICVAALVWIFR